MSESEKIGNPELLPIEQKSGFFNNPKNINRIDAIKRVAKVAGNFTLAGVGLVTSAALTVPALAAIVPASGVISAGALATALVTAVRGGREAIYKDEPSLAFQSRKALNGETKLFQDALQIPTYLRGLSKIQKGAVMALQTMIGFERNKVEFELGGKEMMVDENGKNVYKPVISTVTHSNNLAMLRVLEDLGYISVISEEEKFREGLSLSPQPKRNALLFEKIGFGEWEEALKVVKAAVNPDRSKLEALKKDFHKISFRLTDKHFDFEKLYQEYGTRINTRELSQEDKRDYIAMYQVFGRGKGVLDLSNEPKENAPDKKVTKKQIIDIKTDKYGRPMLVYGVKESFGARIDRQIESEKAANEEKDDFSKKIEYKEKIIVPEQTVEGQDNRSKQSEKQIEEI